MTDLSPEARALLRAARRLDDPTEQDSRRVRSSVLARVGTAAGIGASIGATVHASSLAASTAVLLGSTAGKIGVALLLAGGLSTGAYVAVRSRAPATAAPVVAQVATAPPVIAPSPAPPTRREEPVPERPSSATTTTTTARNRAPAPATRRARSDLEAEVRLLQEADAELRRRDPEAALARLAEHASKYPSGTLAQEREGIRVIALCRAGRLPEGRAAAERFLSQAPKSSLATRVRAACGES